MNTASPTPTTPCATKATPIPACYYYPPPTPPIECSSGAGSANSKGSESRVFLLLCLRGIAAFCWAASRRTLERMLLAYLQSAVNPTWHSLIAGLTAAAAAPARASSAPDDAQVQVLGDKEGGGVVASPKKVFWSYLRGA